MSYEHKYLADGISNKNIEYVAWFLQTACSKLQ